MSKLKFIIKVGPTSTRDKKTFDNESSPAARKAAISGLLLDAIQKAGEDPALDKFVQKMADVQDFIRADLERFAADSLHFFLSQQSAEDGRPLRLQFNTFSKYSSSGLGFKSAFSSLAVSNQDLTVLWPALGSRTIQNKHGDTTYFVHTGGLLDELSSKLFPFFKTVLSSTIRVIKEDVSVKTGPTTKRIARVEVTVAASKKGVNLGNLPVLKTGDFRTIGSDYKERADFNLLSRYMGEQVAYKLTNFGKDEKKDINRPLITPLLGWYIIQRLPVVLELALKRHFKVKPSKTLG